MKRFLISWNILFIFFLDSLTKNINDIIDNTRITGGVGLVYHFPGIGRIELNYSVPIRKESGDTFQAFQFGFGFTL